MFFLILLYPILGDFTMISRGNNGVNVDAEIKFIVSQNVRVALKIARHITIFSINLVFFYS